MVDYFTGEEQWDAKIYLMNIVPSKRESAFLAQIEELDWIQATGFTAVCVTPVFRCVPEYEWHYDPDPCKILNHREINTDLGTMEDFLRLVDEIRRRGMKVILQMVMASLVKTSPLFAEHPEYFLCQETKREPFRLENLLEHFHVTREEFVAETGLTEADFHNDYGNSDRDKKIPLDYSNPGLWDYQESCK